MTNGPGTRTILAAWLRSPWAAIACLFALLPITAGLIFRTYQHEVDPLWFELVRQLDLFFLLVEGVVIATARKRGFSYGVFFRGLPRDVRWATILFLSTFWIGSVFVTDFTPYAMLRAALWPVHLLFGASLWYLGGRVDGPALRRIVLVLVIGYVAYLPLLAGHFLTAPDPVTLREGVVVWSSALPGYLSVRIFGMELAVLLALLLGCVWDEAQTRSKSVLVFASMTIVGGAICWSGTRAAIFGVAGAALITIVMRRQLPRPGSAVLVMTGMLLGGGLSSLLLPPEAAFGFRIMPEPSGADYSSGRIQVWIEALRLILARPLTGWGEGSFIWLATFDGANFAQPHNIALQMLQSWGAPAACAVFYLIGRLWFALQRRGAQNGWMLPLLMAFDTLLIMSLVDGVFYHARLLMLVALISAAALRAPQMQRRSSASVPEPEASNAVLTAPLPSA
jgi:exopolysaccharide production protein ExoQ